MIYPSPPPLFRSRFSVAAFLVEHDGRILLLHRNDAARTWGFPAGSIEDGESPIAAAMRELSEETGYTASMEDAHDLGTSFARGSLYDYTLHLYRIVVDHPITVRLDEREHIDYRWVTPSEALALPYIEDLDAYLHLHYSDQLGDS